eukprot:jgi/Tetstr1/462593/TSEL_007579.t1
MADGAAASRDTICPPGLARRSSDGGGGEGGGAAAAAGGGKVAVGQPWRLGELWEARRLADYVSRQQQEMLLCEEPNGGEDSCPRPAIVDSSRIVSERAGAQLWESICERTCWKMLPRQTGLGTGSPE